LSKRKKKPTKNAFGKFIDNLGKGIDKTKNAFISGQKLVKSYSLNKKASQKTHENIRNKTQNQISNLQYLKRNDCNFNYVGLMFPFGLDKSLDKNVFSLINYQMPVFDYVPGI
jgi:hypothetical protein